MIEERKSSCSECGAIENELDLSKLYYTDENGQRWSKEVCPECYYDAIRKAYGGRAGQ